MTKKTNTTSEERQSHVTVWCVDKHTGERLGFIEVPTDGRQPTRKYTPLKTLDLSTPPKD